MSVLVFGFLIINFGVMVDEFCELFYNVVNDWGIGVIYKINFIYNGFDVEGWQFIWIFFGSEIIFDLWGGVYQ